MHYSGQILLLYRHLETLDMTVYSVYNMFCNCIFIWRCSALLPLSCQWTLRVRCSYPSVEHTTPLPRRSRALLNHQTSLRCEVQLLRQWANQAFTTSSAFNCRVHGHGQSSNLHASSQACSWAARRSHSSVSLQLPCFHWHGPIRAWDLKHSYCSPSAKGPFVQFSSGTRNYRSCLHCHSKWGETVSSLTHWPNQDRLTKLNKTLQDQREEDI